MEWITEIVDAAFVLPDGTIITGEEEVERELQALQQQEEELIGAQLFFTEDIWTVDVDDEPGEVIGSSHISCVFQVDLGRANCDGAFDLDVFPEGCCT